MSKILVLMSVFFLQSGFMMANPIGSQISAMEKTIQHKVFKNLTDDTKFSISLPRTHDGQFSAIDQLNFVIRSGQYKDSNASAIVVKKHDSKTWDILDLYIEQDGVWTKAPRTSESKHK